eukprot:scaffold16206_cov134-Isochrysis_galbana.AAC.9
METVAMRFHCPDELGRMLMLNAGDDACEVQARHASPAQTSSYPQEPPSPPHPPSIPPPPTHTHLALKYPPLPTLTPHAAPSSAPAFTASPSFPPQGTLEP